MSTIETAGSLRPGTADTPLDQRTRVNSTADISNIELPYLGMLVYCIETGKYYKITKLKAKQLGALTVPDAAVDTYEELGASSDGDFIQQPVPGGGTAPSTLTLPIPSDDDGNNISLIVDFSLTGDFAEGDYTRVTMIDHYQRMKIFIHEHWEQLGAPSIGMPYYYGSVTFSLDAELIPGYTPGQKYFARYTWMDSQGATDGWIGFSFSGDVADLRPIRLPEKITLDVRPEEKVTDAELFFDYANGEVQNVSLLKDATLRLENVTGVQFGHALIVNIDLHFSTLTVVGRHETISYTGSRTYMVIFSNFGTLNVSVCEVL